jgi:twinkle protein
MNDQRSTFATTADGLVQSSRMSPGMVEWFVRERGISLATLAQFDAASGTAFFPELERKTSAVFFRYQEGWKARAYPEKAFVAGGGFKLSFWNLHQVILANPDEVFIVEGECDAMALVEAGIQAERVLSVPNGAKIKPADDPKELRGYDYVTEALAAGLSRVKRFVWCGDSDTAGRALREDMVRIIGAARFHFVEWPDGIKDANEMLLKDGAQALRELVWDGALPWPVAGLYRLNELPEPPQMVLWKLGVPEWENKVHLAPRTLSVVTGHPGHGKTALWNQIWFNIVDKYSVPFCGASFETRPKPHVRRQLRTLLMGALECHLSGEDRKRADNWINDRYLFLVHPESRPTLEWFLDMAEVAVIRHGARIIQVDPWNRLEAARTFNETETDYIGRCLRTMHTFATDMNCHVQILAHPSKMDGNRRGSPPMLEDIAGSKNWENMVDQGFCVHRPKMFERGEIRTKTAFFHRKARFEELGHPCKLMLDYRLAEGRYVHIDDDESEEK